MIEVNYYNWQEKISQTLPENMRIDNDLIIISESGMNDLISAPRKVDVTTFIIVDSGRSKAIVDGRQYSLEAPAVAVVMPDQTYLLLEASDDLKFRAIVMSRKFTDSLFGLYNGNSGLYAMIAENPVLDISSDLASFNTYYKILLTVVKSPLKKFRFESAKHLTLSMLYHYSRKLENVIVEKDKRQIRYEQFLADVRKNYRINRTLPFYAGKLGVSVSYLTDLMKDKHGMTAAEYIDRQTVIECKALLNSTDLPVARISRMLNYPSPSVFGKFFKRMTGISPTEYRDFCHPERSERYKEQSAL